MIHRFRCSGSGCSEVLDAPGFCSLCKFKTAKAKQPDMPAKQAVVEAAQEHIDKCLKEIQEDWGWGGYDE